MFNKKTVLLILLFSATLFTQAQEVKFAGTADKKYDGNKVVLYNRATGDHDSATVRDGKFVLTTTFKGSSRYFFYSDYELKTKHGYTPFGIVITKPGTILVKADMENFSASKIKGSKENIDDLTNKYGQELVNNRKPDTSDPKYKQLIQDYNDFSKARQKLESERLSKFITANPASFAAVLLLDNYSTSLEPSTVEDLYATLTHKYKDTRNGKSIAKTIEARKITALGKIAPDFSEADTLGTPIKLSAFRGKYVLVDFWASWCGPCRAENPNLVKTFNRFKDKGFTVLSVSLDQPGKKDAWIGAIHKDNLTWTHVSDLKFWDNDVAVLYGVKAIPTNLLLDKDGKIVAKDLRGAELDKKLSEFFGE
jgi:peroxiredoxin